MSKVKTVNYDGSTEEVVVSDEVFEIFEDNRKLDQRLAKKYKHTKKNEMRKFKKFFQIWFTFSF